MRKQKTYSPRGTHLLRRPAFYGWEIIASNFREAQNGRKPVGRRPIISRLARGYFWAKAEVLNVKTLPRSHRLPV